MKFLNNLAKRHIIATASIVLIASLLCVSAFALNITRSELSIYEKSSGVTVNDSEPLEENNTITPDVEFSEINDFITYKLTLSDNDNSKYRITNISDNNTNENITVSYSHDNSADTSNKDIFVTLAYTNEPTDTLNLSDFDITIDYEEIATDDKDNNDEEDLPVPNTSSQTSNTSAPDTGSQTFSKTFSLKNSNSNISPILLGAVICISIVIFYLLFRRSHKKQTFNLTQSSRQRQTVSNIIGFIIAGLIITGGAIGIAHAADSGNIKLSFDLSKIKINVPPTLRTVQFINNAPSVVTSIQNDTKTCDLYLGDTSCEITLPNFTTIAGHEILGWSTDRNATTALYQPGATITFSNDTVLYTITRSELSALFINQHEEYFTISSESDSCYIYNSDTNCSITTPTANKKSADDSEFLGWNTNASSSAPEVIAGTSTNISEDTAFYSIASIPPTIVSIQFVNQDPVGISIPQASTTCAIPAGETNCSITLPAITTNPNYEALGWSTAAGSTTASYSAGQTVTVSDSTTFYTVSSQIITAIFENLYPDHFSISSSSETCRMYNGSISGCAVSTPTVIKLSSDNKTSFLGWNTNPNTQTGMETNSSIILYASNTYYSIAKVPTNTTYSLKFANDLWGGENYVLTYFNPTENCTREDESYAGDAYCVEVTKSCTLYTWESSCAITAPEFNTVDKWDTYGYDTINPMYFHGPTSKTENFAEIGDNITVTASNNNSTYYTIIRNHTPTTVTFINQHTNYLTSSSGNESCYKYNYFDICMITNPTLTLKEPNDNVTQLAWSRDSNAYLYSVNPGETMAISQNETYYSAATGFEYTITFNKNVSFPGSNPAGDWETQNNIAADSLSFYSTKCTVTPTGCIVANPPRIYSTGNTPIGFSLSQYGDADIVNLTNYNFIKDTTVYARNFNWNNIQASSMSTKKIYQPNSSTEYYPVDFEAGLQEDFVDYYSDYLERVFDNLPQLFVLRGKIRFFNKQTYDQYYNTEPGSNIIMTINMYGLYSPIDAGPLVNNYTTDPLVTSALVLELGHALDSAWVDLYGSLLSSQTDIQNLYDKYKAKYDAYLESHGTFNINDGVPLRKESYTDALSFLAEAFAVWYANKSEEQNIHAQSFGYIEEDISDAIDSYICNAEYTKLPYISSSPICNNNN